MKKGILAIGVAMCLLLLGNLSFAASLFKDVKEGHWAEDYILWGVSEGIIQGYRDGTFRPNDKITEAEFLKMIVATYEIQLPKDGELWYDPYYKIAKDNNWLADGIAQDSSTYRNKQITRGEAAKIIASADGIIFLREIDAVQYLFDNKMSEGKTSKTYVGYAPKQLLTRAEAIKFIKSFVDNRQSNHLKKAVIEQDPSIPVLLPALDSQSKLISSLQKSGYEVKANHLVEGSTLELSVASNHANVMLISIDITKIAEDPYVQATVSMVKDGYKIDVMADIMKMITKNSLDLSQLSYGKTQSMKALLNGILYNFVESETSIQSTIRYKL